MCAKSKKSGYTGKSSATTSQKHDAATMKDINTTLKNLQQMKQDGNISGSQFNSLVDGLASNYGISKKDMDAMKKSVLSESTKGAVGDVENLPGQNGNPWPPDAGKNHLQYEGGQGLGIWNQFGGGIKNGGVSSGQAKAMYDAVDAFTGDYYDDIREAMQNGDTTSTWGKAGVTCEKFIAAGVKAGQGWNGGATYRGVGGLSNEALTAIHNLKPGDDIDCNWGGCASWSTRRSVSEHFGSSYNHVTFVHVGGSQPKGISVARIAHFGTGEQEVLVSKDAKFKVVGVVPGKVGGYSQTYVYVDNA